MKLLISQLLEGENRISAHSQKDIWLKELAAQLTEQGYTFTAPLSVSLTLTKLEPDYYLRGQMEFGVEQTCARCAEAFPFSMRHSFEIALAHVSNPKAVGTELSQESEELDVNFFEGNEIELTPLLAEQFVLSLPYQTVCRLDCQGICQSCGQNLNNKRCGCSEVHAPTPFSVLQNLKL